MSPENRRARRVTWRLADELKRGEPILLSTDDGHQVAVMAMDLITRDALEAFEEITDRASHRIVITARRAETLRVGTKGWRAVSLARPDWLTESGLEAVADPTKDINAPLKGPFDRLDQAPTELEEAALTLCRMAYLMPSVMIGELKGNTSDILETLMAGATADVFASQSASASMTLVTEAALPIGPAENGRLATFRSAAGGQDWLALRIPGDNPIPLVRLHSECFTGDLLGSLKCDCGPQLRGAIARIAEDGGGTVLYLPQEGRGIGLAPKLRAYSLQDQGYDTVDANLRLGFDTDERDFRPAAAILKLMGYDRIRLLTNNPNKADVLTAEGIEVVERVQHQFPTNPYNAHYLEVKKTRTGHLLT